MGEWWSEFRGRGVKDALKAAERYAANEAAIDALLAGGGSILHQATMELDHDQIRQLPSIYQTIVPTPGPNKALIPISWSMIVDVSAGVYTNVDAFNLGAQTGIIFLAWGDWNDEASAYARAEPFLEFTGRSVFGGLRKPLEEFAVTTYPLTQWNPTTSAVDEPLKLVAGNNSGNYLDGNAANTLRVSVAYLIWDVTTGVFE